jgi:hypothetical protein
VPLVSLSEDVPHMADDNFTGLRGNEFERPGLVDEISKQI